MPDRHLKHPSPTGHWVNGTLVPHPETADADTTVWFALPLEDGQQLWEGMAAASQADGSFVVRAVPLFAYGLNYGDRVTAIPSAEGPLVATGVVEDGRHFTFRVALHDGGATVEEVVRTYGSLGCLVEGWSHALVGLSCEESIAQVVADRLADEERQDRLAYETGRLAS